MSDQANSEALVLYVPEIIDQEDYGTDAWQRMAGESIEHYKMFKYYCHMVSWPDPASVDYTSKNNRGRFRKRSLQRVQKVMRVAPTLIYELARKYNWDERAKSYDEYMVQREQEALEVTQYMDAQKWAKRKEAQREIEWQVAEKLIAQGKRMLEHLMSWPLVRETIEMDKHLTEEGIIVQTIIIKEPAEITLQDIARVFELGSKLARLSAGMSQGHSTRSVAKFDFSNMSDEELEKVAAGEIP